MEARVQMGQIMKGKEMGRRRQLVTLNLTSAIPQTVGDAGTEAKDGAKAKKVSSWRRVPGSSRLNGQHCSHREMVSKAAKPALGRRDPAKKQTQGS